MHTHEWPIGGLAILARLRDRATRELAPIGGFRSCTWLLAALAGIALRPHLGAVPAVRKHRE